eukprot:TRINITY_DN3141_c0_g1_i4.p1 TRINITY_DN3141_c0_g1~~TRINITY_DN3141_c0_g1_i4.p1  ORF type:complete len:644 (-),score=128.12 TRINITY_DN3141_c0_g1_i4:74-1981(-)
MASNVRIILFACLIVLLGTHVNPVYTSNLGGFSAPLSLAPYPLQDVVDVMLNNLANAPAPAPTNLTRNSYLDTIASIVKFFLPYQDAQGRIIDPYAKMEIQYASPTYALNSALIANWTHDSTLLKSSIAAFESSLQELKTKTCAQGHCNFYTLPLMLTYELYINCSLVPQAQIETWASIWRSMNTSVYINLSSNWGIVAAGGEFLRYLHNFTDLSFVELQLQQQLPKFSLEGMYPDPNTPMPYDIFPRHYLDMILMRGYNGQYRDTMQELLQRGAWTSAMMQSPLGEWPVGGRSSQHQWNEACETVLFELYASRMKAQKNNVAASAFKRAARLALQSVQRWYQSGGDLYIVKNHFDPSLRFGYEEYSFLSQYNNLPGEMLAMSFLYGDETIEEGPSFTETGGYAFMLPMHHKIFGNAGGMYVEIEMAADENYDPTGLMRIHRTGVASLIGPTEGVTITKQASPMTPVSLGLGVGWMMNDAAHTVQTLSQFTRGHVNATILNASLSPKHVTFNVIYEIDSTAVREVREAYSITPDIINVTASIVPKSTIEQLFVTFPTFMSDGIYDGVVSMSPNIPQGVVEFRGSKQTFTVTSPASGDLAFYPETYTSRNGYMARLVGSSKNITSVSYSMQPEATV